MSLSGRSSSIRGRCPVMMHSRTVDLGTPLLRQSVVHDQDDRFLAGLSDRQKVTEQVKADLVGLPGCPGEEPVERGMAPAFPDLTGCLYDPTDRATTAAEDPSHDEEQEVPERPLSRKTLLEPGKDGEEARRNGTVHLACLRESSECDDHHFLRQTGRLCLPPLVVLHSAHRPTR